jgi:phosphoribosylanthranilate isomerase
VELNEHTNRVVTDNPFNSKRFFINALDRVQVKICGVKSKGDAMAAIDSGADALGFNLYPTSKRFIRWQEEAAWIAELPAEIARIAVTVDLSLNDARQLTEVDLFDGLQLHGEETAEYCDALAKYGKPLIKSIRLTSVALFERVRDYAVFGFLFDGYREGEFGGTGQRFDWTLLNAVAIEKPMIVAGGLTPENVAHAVRMIRPHAVDVASGVENIKGSKDKRKMERFIQAVRCQQH